MKDFLTAVAAVLCLVIVSLIYSLQSTLNIPIKNDMPEKIEDPFINDHDPENVHDSSVRAFIWKKIYKLHKIAKKQWEPILGDGWLEIMCENSVNEMIRDTDQRFFGVHLLMDYIMSDGSITITGMKDDIWKERHIFGLVHNRFKSKKLDMNTLMLQIDESVIVDDNNITFMCTTGRVSRYVGALTGIDPDTELAAPELSKIEIKSMMLARTKALLYKSLSPLDKEIYEKQDLNKAEASYLDRLLKKIKIDISAKLKKEFPLANKKDLFEVLNAIG